MTAVALPPANSVGAEFEGFDIVAIPGRTFEFVRSLPEHTLYRLEQKNRILVVEPFQSITTLIREAKRQKRSWKLSYGLRQQRKNLWVYTPPPLGVPGHTRHKISNDWNSWALAQQLKWVTRRLGFRNPIVWSFTYNSGRLQRHLKGNLTIYDCIDNYEALARDDRHRTLVARYDRETCESADIVFACTELLANTRRVHNSNTLEVHCAADAEFYGQALAPETLIPADIAALPQPVLGYIGGCDPYRINTELVRYVAQAHPDWTIAFVGFMWFGFDQSALAKLPNVHFLGAKDYEQFPGYLKGMRVCLAPFNINDLTLYGDALKIYEYLAAGRPVVSTSIPAACRLRHLVRIADEPHEFVQAIEGALAESTANVPTRLDAIQEHTWQKRVDQKWQYIRQFLANRNERASVGR